ncbi:hypothetical protein E2C01_054734 [Portunus trituberculatus]|uniref:Uncharacterized protein n=1 Tax=Portunus trituberculatus TaxID=210409 RepID=A0A5B7GUQ8_PORTR|nr:hypothetical protein [Portunus trituberculatus]
MRNVFSCLRLVSQHSYGPSATREEGVAWAGWLHPLPTSQGRSSLFTSHSGRPYHPDSCRRRSLSGSPFRQHKSQLRLCIDRSSYVEPPSLASTQAAWDAARREIGPTAPVFSVKRRLAGKSVTDQEKTPRDGSQTEQDKRMMCLAAGRVDTPAAHHGGTPLLAPARSPDTQQISARE